MTYTELWALSELKEKKRQKITHRTMMIVLEHTFIAYPTMMSSLDYFFLLMI